MRLRNVNALTLGRWRIMPASDVLKATATKRGGYVCNFDEVMTIDWLRGVVALVMKDNLTHGLASHPCCDAAMLRCCDADDDADADGDGDDDGDVAPMDERRAIGMMVSVARTHKTTQETRPVPSFWNHSQCHSPRHRTAWRVAPRVSRGPVSQPSLTARDDSL